MSSRLFAAPLFLLLFLLASPSLAQDEAADDADDLVGVDEIVVTITKRAESLQEVPATISAFSADMIRETNVENVADVVNLIPNAQTKSFKAVSVTIRGIAESFTGVAPVAHHVNGVFRTPGPGIFYDLASIEVLRGVSGTIYGRNATSGAINYNWKNPHAGYEVFGDVTVGNYDLYQFRGGVNIPLLGEGDERLMARVSFQRRKRDEWIHITNRPQAESGSDLLYFRGALRSVLSEDLNIGLRGYWSEDTAARMAVPVQDPGGDWPVGLFDLGALGAHPLDPLDGYKKFLTSFANSPPGGFNTILTTLALATLPPGSTREDAAAAVLTQGNAGFGVPAILPDAIFSSPPKGGEQRAGHSSISFRDNGRAPTYKHKGFEGNLEYMMRGLPLLGDVRLDVLGGFRQSDNDVTDDADGTSVPLLDQLIDSDNKAYTAEVRLTSENDDPYSWIVGFFYFRSDQDSVGGAYTPFGFFPSATSTDSKAVATFASATLRPFELFQDEPTLDLEIFAGFRHNRDTRDVVRRDAVTGDVTFSDGGTFRENTYEGGIRWFPADDHMVYLKYAKGYKPGLPQTLEDPVTLELLDLPIESEIVQAWEAGWKSAWWENRLLVNLTAFTYDYTDLQVNQLRGRLILTENAGAASIDGIELEAVIRPTPEWNIRLAGGWLDATFDEFCSDDPFDFTSGALSDPACAITDPAAIGMTNRQQDLAGNRLEDAPEFKVSIVTSYTLDLGERGTLTPVLSFTWTDDYFRSFFNRPHYDTIDSYTRTDFHLTWRSADRAYSVEIFVDNIEDEIVHGRTIVVELPTAVSFFGMQPPRIYGVRFGFNWGGS